MKRSGLLAVLMLLSSSAYAGPSFSFSVGGHRIHIESARGCRSTSCASVSVSGLHDGRKRGGDDDSVAAQASAPAATSSIPAAVPAAQPPAPVAAVPVVRPAASATPIMQAPPPALARPETIAPPPSLPPLPPPPLEKPVEAARPAPPLARVSREAEDEPADGPVGDWQTEGRGLVRIVRCGVALCGYVLNASSNDRGEAVLVNMKPKTDTQWTGHVYSQASGDSYYGTMTMRGTSTLRVEACALGRFYCTGNLWARTGASAERIVTSRQAATEPRS